MSSFSYRTKEAALDALDRLARRLKTTQYSFIARTNPSLLHALEIHFGSWTQARAALHLRLDPHTRRAWTRYWRSRSRPLALARLKAAPPPPPIPLAHAFQRLRAHPRFPQCKTKKALALLAIDLFRGRTIVTDRNTPVAPHDRYRFLAPLLNRSMPPRAAHAKKLSKSPPASATSRSVHVQALIDRSFSIPLNDNESFEHWILKIMAARMLPTLDAATTEARVELAGVVLRPDLLSPNAWFECNNSPRRKLEHIVRHFHGRVIHLGNFWWGDPKKTKELVERDLRRFNTTRYTMHYAPTLSPAKPPFDGTSFDPVPGVEHWFCDLRTPPTWGVTVDADGRLRFLGNRTSRYLETKFEREQGRCPYEIELRDFPPKRFLHRGRSEQNYLADLLAAWGFAPRDIAFRPRVTLASNSFVPYVLAGDRVWIERSHNVERLEFIAQHSKQGRVIVLDDRMTLRRAAGVEHWHFRNGLLTGWGTTSSGGFWRSRSSPYFPFHAADWLH